MKVHLRIALALAFFAMTSIAFAADWKAVEAVETYAIDGSSGPDLYASIGRNGPTAGAGRAIAHTNFTLTWTRKYQTKGGGCTITVARPKLTITYTLPKPRQQLSPIVRARWEAFIAGVQAHERVHGDQIKSMVNKIQATSLGLAAENDPKCQEIRSELKIRLSALSQAQREQNRDFDRVEMGEGGMIRRLILDLVNG